MRRDGEWGEWDHLLPTAAGMSTGVVEAFPQDLFGRSWTTVQCSVCFRTYTDETFWAVKEMNFAPDDEEVRLHGHTRYRRCRSCREAGKHPDAAG